MTLSLRPRLPFPSERRQEGVRVALSNRKIIQVTKVAYDFLVAMLKKIKKEIGGVNFNPICQECYHIIIHETLCTLILTLSL